MRPHYYVGPDLGPSCIEKYQQTIKIVTVKRVHMTSHLIPLYNYMIRVAYPRQKSVLEHIPHNHGVFAY